MAAQKVVVEGTSVTAFQVSEVFRQIGGGELTGDHIQALIEHRNPFTDEIIRVNRSIRPVYPEWMKEVCHPELEAVGPAEYDLTKVLLYLHDRQKDDKWMRGTKLYEHLKETDSLKNCLGLHDALEIQKKGIKVFRKLFGGKAVFCWKSVVRNRDGVLNIPYLCEIGGEVLLNWYWLGSALNARFPALRFV